MYKQKINEYMAGAGENQSSVAKKIGVSPSALSQYLAGKYPTPMAIEPKIKEFFAMLEMKGSTSLMASRPEFKPTSISDTVINTIAYCHVQRAMGAIYGDAGIGKTMSVNKYEEDHTEAIVISAAFALSKPMSFLKALARKLRTPEVRRQDDLYIDLVDKLRGSEKILIIDEAQHLPHSTLEIIRGLHDDAEVPVVLVGNQEVYSKLVGRGEAAFAQLFSRIAIRKNMLTGMIKLTDVERIFTGLGEAETKFLHDVSRSRWGLRGAVYVYLNAANNGDLSVEGIKKMVKFMGIGA